MSLTVAARAGVSIASASRVLNGLGGRAETVRKVREAADAVGYVPNAIARSLQAQRTDLVALAVADIGNPVYVAMMRAVEAVVAASGRQLVVHATGGQVANETALLRRLAYRYVDGMIISPIRVTEAHLDCLTGTAVPVVVVGQLPEQVPLDNVRADSRHGMRLAVDHLVGTGRRRIGLLNGPLDTVPGATRDAGFRAALAAHGLPVDERLVEVGDFFYEPGRAAAQRLLDRERPPAGRSSSHASLDAIVCANDVIAAGALHTLLARGIRVPERLPVIVDAFRPSTREVERARDVLAAVARARARGSGTAVLADGRWSRLRVRRCLLADRIAFERHGLPATQLPSWVAGRGRDGDPYQLYILAVVGHNGQYVEPHQSPSMLRGIEPGNTGTVPGGATTGASPQPDEAWSGRGCAGWSGGAPAVDENGDTNLTRS